MSTTHHSSSSSGFHDDHSVDQRSSDSLNSVSISKTVFTNVFEELLFVDVGLSATHVWTFALSPWIRHKI